MHLTKLRISLNANLAYGANFKVKLTGMVLGMLNLGSEGKLVERPTFMNSRQFSVKNESRLFLK